MFQVKDDKRRNYFSIIIPAVILVAIVLLVKMIPRSHREPLSSSEVDITRHVDKTTEHKCKPKPHYFIMNNVDCNLTDSSIKVTQVTYRNGKKVQVLHDNDAPKVMSVKVKATINYHAMNGIEKQEVHGGQ